VSIKVDLRDFKRFTRDLEVLREKQIPHAIRDTLNAVAFEGRKRWNAEVQKSFILRNTFTQRSLQVEKARGTNLQTMQSTLGAKAPWMGKQEEGFTHTAQGKHGVAVPTPAAAGMGAKARIRTRSIRKSNYLAAINMAKRVPGSRARKNAAALSMAKRGTGFAYIDTGKHRGIVSVEGTQKRKKAHGPMQRGAGGREVFGYRIRVLYDLSQRRTVVKERPTLARTIKAVAPLIPMMGQRAILKQLLSLNVGGRRR
jgi:hypothetical protein